MGALSSIHFKPTKHDIQEKHNDRTIAPHYVLKSGGLGIECNHNALEARALRDSLVEQAKLHYKHHVNQPFKAKSYLWSAVVNLKDTSAMQDLERLANHFKDKYGFQCYQIAIHRDEGHVDENGVLHLNHHAHLEFVTLDEKTGRSLFRKVTPKVLRQFQDEVAQILGMERGEYVEKSGRKRIEPRAYGALMEKAREERKGLKEKLDSAGILEHKFRCVFAHLIDAGGEKIEDDFTAACKERGVWGKGGLEATKGQLEVFLKLMENEFEEIKKLKEDYNNLQADFTRSEHELKGAKEQHLADMNAICAIAGQPSKQSENLEKASKNAKQSMRLWRVRANKYGAEVGILKQDNACKDNTLATLSDENTRLAKESQDNLSCKLVAESECNELKEKLARSEQKRMETKDRASQRVTQLKTRLYSTRDEGRKLQQEIASKDIALATKDKTISELTADLDAIFTACGLIDPSKKLTAKERSKDIEGVVKEWVQINSALGDLKLYTQQDYMELRQLKQDSKIKTIGGLQKRIRELEDNALAQYKDKLDELESQHQQSLKDKDEAHQQALEAKKQEYQQTLNDKDDQIKQLKSDKANLEGQLQTKEQEHTKDLQAMQNKISSLEKEKAQKDTTISDLEAQITQYTQELEKVKPELATLQTNANTLQDLNNTQAQTIKRAQEANEKLQQAKQTLEAKQKSLTQELESSKQEIATLKTTNKELQQENLKLKPVYLTKEQIKARRLAERQELMGKGCPKEAFRELSALDDEKLTQAQLDERILNIWLKYAPDYIADLESTQANLEQENQTLKTELKTAKTEAKSQAHIKAFEREAVNLIRKHVAPVSTGVVAHIQASGEKITAIHKQCQEEMIQQASVCVVFGEELKAGKFKAFNNVKKLFGKGVKDPITYEYVERGKIHYRELNRREQAIKDTLADTLNKHSHAVQTINNQACQVILEAVESVKDGIAKLATEFKNSAEYGAELNQTKGQIDSLKNDKERLQNKVSALEKEQETNKQEVEKARINNEAFKRSGIENTRLRNDLQTAKTELETTQADLKDTKTKLEDTQSALQALQKVIEPEATLTPDDSKTIDTTQPEPTKGHRPKI
ncbi:CCDC158 family protein [Helicobacter salomonis]|uniref:hypothetical protein n=1 Tax=Helicobacter salomonis TaxID=56878 RepID=UPI0018F7ED6D|nr:hypothetical protein [Helicobacter salomonis]